MEFKRNNSSRSPAAPSHSTRKNSTSTPGTPLRSSTPLKKASARGAATPTGKSPTVQTRTPPPVSPRATTKPKDSSSDGETATCDSEHIETVPITTPTSAGSPTSVAAVSPTTANITKSLFKRSGSTMLGLRRALVAKQNNRVNVYVRVRAFSAEEKSGAKKQLAVDMTDNSVSVQVPKKGSFTFNFDNCFWSSDRECPSGKAYTSQEDVFEEIGRPLVENALAGYNAAVMAYGQTGSGKTYTSFGPVGSLGSTEEGLIPRVCNMIFARAANSVQKGVKYTVRASMLEVYLEEVFDLLNARKELSVRHDVKRNVFQVVGAKMPVVRDYNDVMAVLNKAEPLRTFAATNIHDHSSRAHTLFMLEITTEFGSLDLKPRCAKILLADLAGCERIKLAGTEEGLAFEQARNINLSLLALGSCIEAVATRGHDRNRPIPEFRNSTLTKLLKDFLGGNSISTMVVTIAPSEADANLSVQTLRFADRAKKVSTHAKVNTVVEEGEEESVDGEDLSERLRDEYLRKKEALYAEYQLLGTIEKLLARIAELEDQLQNCDNDEIALHLSTELEEVQKTLADADTQLGAQRQILYGEYLMLEDELRDMNTKMQAMQEAHEDALEAMLGEEAGKFDELKSHTESEVEALKRRIRELEEALQKKTDECDSLKAQLAKMQRENEETNDALQQQLDDQVKSLKQMLDNSRKETATLTTQSAAKEEELNAMIESLRAEADTLQRSVEDTQCAFEQEKNTGEREIAQLTAQLQTLTNLHATSSADNAEQITTYAAKLASTSHELKSTEKQLATAQANLETTRGTLKVRDVQLRDVQAALAEKTEVAENLSEALARMKDLHTRETTLAQQLNDQTVAKLDDTEEQLRETAEALQDTAAQLQEKSASADELQTKLDDTEDHLQEATGRLADAEAVLQETAQRLADTEDEMDLVKEQLATEIAGLDEQIAVLQRTELSQNDLITRLMEYCEQTVDTTMHGLTEVNEQGLRHLMYKADEVINGMLDVAGEMFNLKDAEARELMSRFDTLRYILGKIDQDVKQATTEVEEQDKRRNTMGMPMSPRAGSPDAVMTPRLGTVTANREVSATRKGRSRSRPTMMKEF